MSVAIIVVRRRSEMAADIDLSVGRTRAVPVVGRSCSSRAPLFTDTDNMASCSLKPSSRYSEQLGCQFGIQALIARKMLHDDRIDNLRMCQWGHVPDTGNIRDRGVRNCRAQQLDYASAWAR